MKSPRIPVVLALALAASCSSVGETGRLRVPPVPQSFLADSALATYEQETSQFPQITSGAQYDMVQRIGKRIAAASGFEADWEFRLLDAPSVVNAFALPGGKGAVYTGLITVAQNEDALAAVMGHEVAHVTAEHGGERVSINFGSQAIVVLGDFVAAGSSMSNENRALLAAALGGGLQVGAVLPFSRTHESEADEIGLRYLVRAGYDPNEAPLLWERMAALSGENTDPLAGFLSTHPDPKDRAARLRELIPTVVAEETSNGG